MLDDYWPVLIMIKYFFSLFELIIFYKKKKLSNKILFEQFKTV